MTTRKNKKLIESFKSKLKENGIDVSEYDTYFKEIENNLKDKKYGLVWENHTEEIETELLTKFPILKEEKELRIHNNNTEEGLTNNFLIEGDNLESLTALKNMGKKVDVIYIDPPYGTGKSFIYEDRFVNKEDSYRHSKWISFMEKRLKIAKDLLTEDGVIFISIDDNEQANLKLLCDSIFGENNFISKLHWRKNNVMMKNTSTFKNMIDYIYVYAKNIKETREFNHVLDAVTTNNYSAISAGYGEKEVVFNEGELVINRGLEIKDVKISKGNYKRLELLDDVEFVGGYNVAPVRIKAEFKWSNKTLGGKLKRPNVYMKVNNLEEFTIRMYEDKEVYIPINYLDKTYGIGTIAEGKEDVKDTLGGGVFDYPKPVTLIKWLVQSYTYYNKGATVVDFFAGSGTTGHAVLEINKEDGGNRNFILCTNNENNICKDITYERLNKVINGYTTPKGKEVEGIPSNLTYLKTGLVDKEDNLGEFGLDENTIEHAINNLKIMQNISNETEIIENVLYELEGNITGTKYVIYNNFYIDEDEIKKINKSENNIIYVSEDNLKDSNLLEFDEVRSLNDLVVYK